MNAGDLLVMEYLHCVVLLLYSHSYKAAVYRWSTVYSSSMSRFNNDELSIEPNLFHSNELLV